VAVYHLINMGNLCSGGQGKAIDQRTSPGELGNLGKSKGERELEILDITQQIDQVTSSQ